MTEILPQVAWSPLVLTGARTAMLSSRLTGTTYQISVWQPPDALPAKGLPVIYVLDAGTVFATFAETLQRLSRRPAATGIQPAVLVGIDQATSAARSTVRQRDYTPGPCRLAGEDETVHGGAALFQDFLEREVMPAIEPGLPIDPARHGLFGHSLSGYFSLWSLISRPGPFASYMAASPSLWWDANAVGAGVTRLTQTDFKPRVYLAVGSWEGPFAPWQQASANPAQVERRARRAMTTNLATLSGQLGSVLSKELVRFDVLEGEDHSSVIAPAISRALRFTTGS